MIIPVIGKKKHDVKIWKIMYSRLFKFNIQNSNTHFILFRIIRRLTQFEYQTIPNN